MHTSTCTHSYAHAHINTHTHTQHTHTHTHTHTVCHWCVATQRGSGSPGAGCKTGECLLFHGNGTCLYHPEHTPGEDPVWCGHCKAGRHTHTKKCPWIHPEDQLKVRGSGLVILSLPITSFSPPPPPGDRFRH